MKRRTRYAPLVLCAGLAIVAAACGSDSKTSATTAAAPAATAAPSVTAAPAATDAAPAATDAATDTAAAGGSGKIGFITKFPVDFYDTMVDAAKAWNADHPEIELIFAQGASGTDDEGEIAAIESMVTQGVKAIVITPTSPNVQDALQKAVDGGIKVILVDNDIPGWDGKTALVATDNMAGGVLAGQFMATQLSPGDSIAILEGVAGAPSLQQRVDGFKQGLGDGFKIVASLPTDCDQTKGLNAAQDILTANPDVKAIYGACGPPILGAIETIKSAGKTIKVVGFDAGGDEVKAIVAGDELASVAQFPAKMGSDGAQAAFDAISGKTVQANIDTGTAMVTKDNAADFGG
ncbi:MAG: sugar ABC transporter substrate-binding protein [Ilumatobacteraceae bacterium]|nr:sugar ABC transporter substrate-binding protein [Ilumatobacteraceae bacterium]